MPCRFGWLLGAGMVLWIIALFAGEGGVAVAFTLTSSAFQDSGTIPKKYTCEGADVSPPLSWSDPPAGTQAFALVADDPDAPAGTWVHWVLYDLPPESRGLPEAVPGREALAAGAKQGLNDFKKVGYGGPCPPPGPAHRYFFKLYALDRMTGLKPRATKNQVLQAIQGHILGETQLMGRYRR